MADLIAYQDGNWTGATTWKGVATGTGAKQATITASTNTTTTDVASSNFTIGNGTVCEGLLLHCNRVNTTGTVTVGLYLGTTLQREVTVNASDLPTAQSWVFFEFATTLTAGNGSTYNVRVKGSSAGNATFFRDATAGNWARYIRNSTTATAAAADVTFICDELTGAGTKVDVTVTMNSTSAATSYGEVNIGQGGVLSYGTANTTNYILDLSGNLNVWGGGTFNIGTASSRMPWSSTGILEFTNAVNVDRGLEVRAGGVCTLFGNDNDSFGNPRTPNALLTADAAAGQAVFVVNSVAGWAANDVVALASTSRTSSHSEKGTISSLNLATKTITLTGNLVNTHHGTGLYVGEVVNLTRNVKIRGTSQTLCAYVNCADTSSFTASYAEFYWLGSATANKWGVDSATTSGTFSLSYCSLYDFNATLGSRTLNLTGSSGSVSIEDCSIFCGFTTGIVLSLSATSGTPSIQRNYFIASGIGVTLSDLGGTIRDNRFGGCGVTFSENGATIGTIKDNVQHSATTGITVSQFCFGTFDGLTVWRNTNGISCSLGGYTIANASAYHNSTANLNMTVTAPNSFGLIVKDSTFNGGSGAGLSQTSNQIAIGGLQNIFDNCTFGNVQTATGFVTVSTNSGLVDCTFRKCSITDSVAIANQSSLYTSQELNSAVKFDTFNNTTGSHRTYKRYGRTESDQSVFRTAAPSEALLPNGGSGNKLPSGSKKFAVADATDATVTVYIYKSATYNGNQPRLMLKANSVAFGGVFTDTVLATASGGTGSWLTLTGTTDSVDRDCVLEVYVDCDGTAGTVYVDDWSVT